MKDVEASGIGRFVHGKIDRGKDVPKGCTTGKSRAENRGTVTKAFPYGTGGSRRSTRIIRMKV